MKPMTFNCGRTCQPFCEECRFMPIFVALGPTRVLSHTSAVECQYKDHDQLGSAVVAMGGTVLGDGLHKLYSSSEQGFGFRLPGWNYPLVLREDMTLAFDDYHGCWGDVKQLDVLQDNYAISVARHAAQSQGWVTETQPNGSLWVYHPEGGYITVTANAGKVDVDLCNFQGSSCVEAGNVIEAALGRVVENVAKPEMFQEYVRLTVPK